MSRRREKARERRGQAETGAAAGESGGPTRARPSADPAPGRRPPPRIPFVAQAGILVAVFAVVSLIADLAGAANLGVALGVGQIAFAIALVAVIVKT
jgi:hypothetical protein